MLETGSIVDGKYKILSEIGHGGMSVVYMAINEKANKTWAIKEVRKDGVLDFEAVKQGLIVETDMLKKLNHPNLPSIIDVIENDDTFLIVMDYIEGNSLSKALEEYGAQQQEYVIEWAKQLCDVLGYLHTREPAIIYRDLKPANIMLKPDGNLTLIDFGTAREFKEKNLADTTCLGTIGYAAPEQFGGMGQTDARTDIYCLGATLYHLVTGKNPSEPPYEMYPIRDINPSLSGGLERIILKCTQRNPEDRYQSTAELMYDLHHYEEIDDAYKKKQMKKLKLFAVPLILSVVSLASAIGLNFYATDLADNTYDTKLENAANLPYEEKRAEYIECVNIPGKAGETKAYIALIQEYKADGAFDVEENDEFFDDALTEDELGVWTADNVAELQKDPDKYAKVCSEIGILYWYYYSYGDSNITRAKEAAPWFKKVIDSASEKFPDLGRAKVYYNIGNFYNSILIATKEGTDKGMYKDLFNDCALLVNTIAVDEDELEVVRLESLNFTLNSIASYATKIKTDGIKREDVNTLIATIENTTATIDSNLEVKDSIMKNLESTKEIVETAYGTKKEVK